MDPIFIYGWDTSPVTNANDKFKRKTTYNQTNKYIFPHIINNVLINIHYDSKLSVSNSLW